MLSMATDDATENWTRGVEKKLMMRFRRSGSSRAVIYASAGSGELSRGGERWLLTPWCGELR
jgi:hypothetical protein